MAPSPVRKKTPGWGCLGEDENVAGKVPVLDTSPFCIFCRLRGVKVVDRTVSYHMRSHHVGVPVPLIRELQSEVRNKKSTMVELEQDLQGGGTDVFRGFQCSACLEVFLRKNDAGRHGKSKCRGATILTVPARATLCGRYVSVSDVLRDVALAKASTVKADSKLYLLSKTGDVEVRASTDAAVLVTHDGTQAMLQPYIRDDKTTGIYDSLFHRCWPGAIILG
jgi:hypothetical protein